ncbi:MAG: arabinan endo-1,5-alpha-L-arabinosidase [Prevotellaceae bacterium]|nr:arabinan endo-1,5-alpha-L-arabinosidase [Prevotellaceae bacterium]
MNKKIFIVVATFMAVISHADAQQLFMKKSDGTYSQASGNLYFSRNGDKDQWSISTVEGGVYRSANDIEKFSKIAVLEGEELQLATYKAPTYNDYYIEGATWENRSTWNLANIHDPSVMLAEDGYYYMYCTDAGYGNPHNEDVKDGKHGHFQCRRSKDLVNWEYMGATMYGLPSWVQPKLNEIRNAMGLANSTSNFSDDLQFGYWAPCARKVRDGLYRMYYCIVCPGLIDGDYSWGERAFIGLMETSDPSDLTKWEDKGYVITNYSDKELDYSTSPYNNNVTKKDPKIWEKCYYKYNAIDPSYIITPEGEHWLIYGSWHSGFAAVEINPETGKTKAEQGNPWGAENEAAYGKRIYTRTKTSRWQGAEAPEVVYRDGYYYLFLAYDGLDVPYNTRVVRSRNIDGPYESMDGVNVSDDGGDAFPIVTHPYQLGGDHGWVGISHCAVFDDGKGNWYYASQQRFPNNYKGNEYSNAVMLGGVRAIRWTDSGWPVVMPERYGEVPQAQIEESELIGTWSHLSIRYSYKNIMQPVTITLGSDHKVTGEWNNGAQWSFDASDNTLTIGGVKLYLSREVNWEASPRKATIVYAGYDDYMTSGTQRTYWGMKE